MTKAIGFDLDGILIGRPPFVPGEVIDFFYKNHGTKELSYRFPGFLEQKIRQLSHLPGVRPPIKQNCDLIFSLSRSKKYQFYIISGRFGFLKDLTYKWLDRYNLTGIFTKIFLNTENLQPHLFKESVLKKVTLDLFIDDDFDTICYLAPKFQKIHFYWYTNNTNTKLDTSNITAIDDLCKIL